MWGRNCFLEPTIFTSVIKTMKVQSFIILLLALMQWSCEKAVSFKLDTVTPKLVVEATIENGQPPLVYLSRSLAYFSTLNPDSLAATFIRNADVWVSDGARTHKLKLYSARFPGGFTGYYYGTDSSSLSTAIIGELNKSYTLRITWEGKEYTASTTIPNTTRRIDSLYWKDAPGGNIPYKVSLMLRATDPQGLGDYIRYFTKQNRDPYYPGLNSVYDDQVIDGTTYEIQVERGILRNGIAGEAYSFFDKGDTVTLKLCNIDKATFDFWRTMEFTYASVGNPFSSPTKVMSNIKGGALGYFGGYAAQYKKIVIPQ